MNDSDFETTLRALHPAAPAPSLEQRIARALADAPQTTTPAAGVLRRPASAGHLGHWLRNLGWATAGALVALAALVVLLPRTAPLVRTSQAPAPAEDLALNSVGTNTFEHASATEELIAAEDSPDIIETEDGLVRTVRYSYRERHAWANPRTGARMEIEVPREDLYLIPVSLQ